MYKAVIQEQQQFIISHFGTNFSSLFCARQWNEIPKRNRDLKVFIPKAKEISPNSFHNYINQLAKARNICTSSGKVWQFQTHQFRHTVGTRMINNGVPQHIIQRYLGHESPEMTSVAIW